MYTHPNPNPNPNPSIQAVRRTYPQIYATSERLLINVTSIKIVRSDFLQAMERIVPSAQRSVASHAKKMPEFLQPLLREQLVVVKDSLAKAFPFVTGEERLSRAFGVPKLVFKPRFMVYGRPGMGQNYFGGELLHMLEELPIFSFDMVTLIGSASKVLTLSLTLTLTPTVDH
jgi:ATPase family AAA domain-containing protein 2